MADVQRNKLLYTVTGLTSEDVKALTDMGVDVIRRGPGHYIYSKDDLDANTTYAVEKYLEMCREDGVEYKKMDENMKSFSKSTLLENFIRIGGRKLNEETEQYRADVAGIGDGSWSNNGMIYDTPEEAKKWLDNLSGRWFGFDMSRVVPASTPTREKIDPNDPNIYQNFRK